MNDLTINEQIRLMLIRRHETMSDLARNMGMTPQAVSQYLKRGNFTLASLNKIAAALGCKLNISLEEVEG